MCNEGLDNLIANTQCEFLCHQAEKLDTREVLVTTILYTHHLVMMETWKG